MAVNRELDRFLESVERRAFVKARLATGNEQEALDIVQDAMFKLVKSYGNKAAEEWPPLFHRILQSRITDWYRRQGTKNRLFAWLSKSPQDGHGEYVSDPPDLSQHPAHREYSISGSRDAWNKRPANQKNRVSDHRQRAGPLSS